MNITAFLNGLPPAQLLSLAAIGAFVAVTVIACLHPVLAAGIVASPVISEYPAIFITVTAGAVFHQSMKIYKGGSAEVDQQ